jgi:hypothetical protein
LIQISISSPIALENEKLMVENASLLDVDVTSLEENNDTPDTAPAEKNVIEVNEVIDATLIHLRRMMIEES